MLGVPGLWPLFILRKHNLLIICSEKVGLMHGTFRCDIVGDTSTDRLVLGDVGVI